ncbi:hypothetical protein AAG570_001461 [Ranatra chinensis]|uniref:Uncharacterized protein n=1 Tax=Ranatra chinensis TaxID=642074 RepID=A0ABD0YR83_9HEMI
MRTTRWRGALRDGVGQGNIMQPLLRCCDDVVQFSAPRRGNSGSGQETAEYWRGGIDGSTVPDTAETMKPEKLTMTADFILRIKRRLSRKPFVEYRATHRAFLIIISLHGHPSAKKRNIGGIQSLQSKGILNAPKYFSNQTNHHNFDIPIVREITQSKFKSFPYKLGNHPNPPANAVIQYPYLEFSSHITDTLAPQYAPGATAALPWITSQAGGYVVDIALTLLTGGVGITETKLMIRRCLNGVGAVTGVNGVEQGSPDENSCAALRAISWVVSPVGFGDLIVVDAAGSPGRVVEAIVAEAALGVVGHVEGLIAVVEPVVRVALDEAGLADEVVVTSLGVVAVVEAAEDSGENFGTGVVVTTVVGLMDVPVAISVGVTQGALYNNLPLPSFLYLPTTRSDITARAESACAHSGLNREERAQLCYRNNGEEGQHLLFAILDDRKRFQYIVIFRGAFSVVVKVSTVTPPKMAISRNRFEITAREREVNRRRSSLRARMTAPSELLSESDKREPKLDRMPNGPFRSTSAGDPAGIMLSMHGGTVSLHYTLLLWGRRSYRQRPRLHVKMLSTWKRNVSTPYSHDAVYSGRLSTSILTSSSVFHFLRFIKLVEVMRPFPKSAICTKKSPGPTFRNIPNLGYFVSKGVQVLRSGVKVRPRDTRSRDLLGTRGARQRLAARPVVGQEDKETLPQNRLPKVNGAERPEFGVFSISGPLCPRSLETRQLFGLQLGGKLSRRFECKSPASRARDVSHVSIYKMWFTNIPAKLPRLDQCDTERTWDRADVAAAELGLLSTCEVDAPMTHRLRQVSTLNLGPSMTSDNGQTGFATNEE